MKKTFIADLISALLILLFLYTGLSKLINHLNFVVAMNKSDLLRNYTTTLSWVVPIIEIMAAIMLSFSKTRLAGLYCSTVLMALFTGYVGLILVNSKNLPCTCGGVLQQMSWHTHLWFNFCFLILSGLGTALQLKYFNNSIIRLPT